MITIREQSSFLTSYYAYDYANLKAFYPSFDSFLDAGIADRTSGVFGLLLYDELYSMMRSALPDNVKIRFVPYETLPASGGRRYLEEFLGPDAWKLTVLAGEVSDEAVLENVEHHLRDQGPVRVFINRLRNLQPSSKYGRMPVFKVLSNIARSRALAAVPAESTRIREESIRMTRDQETEARNLYAMSNRRIDEVLGLGLGALGYSLNPRK